MGPLSASKSSISKKGSSLVPGQNQSSSSNRYVLLAIFVSGTVGIRRKLFSFYLCSAQKIVVSVVCLSFGINCF